MSRCRNTPNSPSGTKSKNDLFTSTIRIRHFLTCDFLSFGPRWGETSTTVSDMKKKIEIPKPKRRKKEPLAVLQPPGGIEQSSLPKTGKCKWTYDALSRVLKADHSLNKSSPFVMDEDDEKFMLQMMERDDITVISGGFVDGKQLDRDIWTMEAVGGMMIGDIYHSIKKLESTETGFR